MLHFYWCEVPKSKPIVLLHGFLESSSMWDSLQLETTRSVLRIDLPGHGQSALTQENSQSMQTMAAAVKEIIDSFQWTNYDVLGHSMGGYVALELGMLDDRSEKVILLNSNLWEDPPEKRIDRQRVADLVQTKKSVFIREAIPNLFHAPEKFPEQVNALIQEAETISAESIARSSMAMSVRRDFSEQLDQLKFDLYVIQGEHDRMADPQRMEMLMQARKGQLFQVDSGHMAHWEATGSVREIVSQIEIKNGNLSSRYH